jgi:hypothetical protein
LSSPPARCLCVHDPDVTQSCRKDTVGPGWSQPRFLALLIIALPATFALEVVLTLLSGKGAGLRFWVKHPRVHAEHEAPGSLEKCEREVRQRVERLGFVWQTTGPGCAQIAKAKRAQVNSFLDHAFSGEVRLGAGTFGTRVELDLTMLDILAIETGERAHLAAVADHLCLRADSFLLRSVPLPVYCGTMLGFATLLVSAAVGYWPGPATAWVFPASAAAMGFQLFALFYVVRDRQQLYGYRLTAVGFALALIPWLAWGLRVAGIAKAP